LNFMCRRYTGVIHGNRYCFFKKSISASFYDTSSAAFSI